jgi:alkaline phosphatase
MRAIVATLLLAGTAAWAAAPAPDGPAPGRPGSVIVVIGDGTGWQQWGLYVASRRAAKAEGLSAFHRLADQGVVGCATTWAADSFVTDSAAGATAIACGVRTNNGAIGVDPEGKPVRTCMEVAARRGLATGIVTTTAVTDATPAAFTAHVPNRTLLNQIAEQQIRKQDLRVILGGGLAHFIPRTKSCAAAGEPGRGVPDAPSRRKDDDDLVAEAKAAGFAFVTNRKALLEGPAPARLLGLFCPSNLPYAIDRDEPGEAEVPTLAEMTARAIEVLGRGDKGYFLVVEGGRVDHGCHHNDAGAALGELRELDAALEVVLAEREKRKDLLVVLTADHETGGLAVSAPKGEQLDAEMLNRLRTQRRSLAAVAEEVGGGRPTLEAAKAAVPWLDADAVPLTKPKEDGRGPYLGVHRKPWADAASGGGGVVFATDGHSATPVPIVAAGPGQNRFAGLRNNVDIGEALIDLLGPR